MQALSLIDTANCVVSTKAMRDRFPEQLAKAIEQMFPSQAEAARRFGFSPSRLNNYLTGTRTPDVETIMRMAKALGTSTDYLTGLSEEPPDIGLVVQQLLEMDGMNAVKAEVIGDIAQEALRLLLALPSEGDAATRSRLAAQAAWRQRGGPRPIQ